MRGIKVPQAPPRSARPPPRAGAFATFRAIEAAKVFGWHKVRPTEVVAPTRRSGTARLISLIPKVGSRPPPVITQPPQYTSAPPLRGDIGRAFGARGVDDQVPHHLAGPPGARIFAATGVGPPLARMAGGRHHGAGAALDRGGVAIALGGLRGDGCGEGGQGDRGCEQCLFHFMLRFSD